MPFLKGKEIERKLAAVKAEVETVENEYFQSKLLEALRVMEQMNKNLDSIELALAK